MADVETVMREAFELGRTGGEAATFPLIERMVVEGHDPEEINGWAERIDPDRLVWDHPAKPGETGPRGWPLLEARYHVCSDVYGHEISVPAEVADHPGAYDSQEPKGSRAFAALCRRGYDDGTLHGRGVVVMDRDSRKLGFLVTVALDAEDPAPMEALADLGAVHGISIEGLAYPAVRGQPGSAVVTAFLDDAHLGLAGEVSQVIHDITRAAATPSPK